MAGVGEGDHALGLEDAGKDVLELPHGKGGAAHVFELGVVGEEIQIARVVGVRGAVAGDVEDDFILRLGFGEEGEEGAADVLGGGVFVEEQADVVFGERAAVGGKEEVAKFLGVAVGELETGDAACGIRVTGNTYYDCEFIGACHWAIGSDGSSLVIPGRCRVGGLQEKRGVVDALHEIGERKFDGVAAGLEMETFLVAQIELAQDSVGHRRGGHDYIGGLGVDFGEEGAGTDLHGALCDVDQELIEFRGGNDGGAVGFQLHLQLGNFQGDGFGDVGGRGGKE